MSSSVMGGGSAKGLFLMCAGRILLDLCTICICKKWRKLNKLRVFTRVPFLGIFSFGFLVLFELLKKLFGNGTVFTLDWGFKIGYEGTTKCSLN